MVLLTKNYKKIALNATDSHDWEKNATYLILMYTLRHLDLDLMKLQEVGRKLGYLINQNETW